MEIVLKNADPVVAFAAAELGKYITQMTTGAKWAGRVSLGLFEDLALEAPKLLDRRFDDAIRVEFIESGGHVAGSNPHSVLLGVYRLLWNLGCRWIRPGADGELVPHRSLSGVKVSLAEQASYRHRVVCIEGAVSLDNVLQTIDWMPKVGLSGFYMQFRDGYTFFDRWYSHEDDPKRKRSPIERGQAIEFTGIIECEIARRGLAYHAVGHGWHTEAYGVPGLGWMAMHDLPAAFREKVALVNGERRVPWDIPMLAALCYSDRQVQAAIVLCVSDYASSHRQVDFLHVWLDDWFNNKCECDRCRAKRPFDWYIQILNGIDAELTRRSIGTRIVFLSYCDLLWPPLTEWFRSSDRFVFMYANGRGDYTKPLVPVSGVKIPPFEQNRLPATNKVEEVAAILQDWQPRVAGMDSFLFEYYDGAEDLAVARVLHQDICTLRQFGMNGMVSCQRLRAHFPTGLGMLAMGRSLWDASLGFDQIAREYADAAYGADGAKCLEFIESAQSLMRKTRQQLSTAPAEAEPQIEELRGLVRGIKSTMGGNRGASTVAGGCQAVSWRMLEVFTSAVEGFIEFANAKRQGLAQTTQFHQHGLGQLLLAVEDELQPYFQPASLVRLLTH
jgi:hypothetical protein